MRKIFSFPSEGREGGNKFKKKEIEKEKEGRSNGEEENRKKERLMTCDATVI